MSCAYRRILYNIRFYRLSSLLKYILINILNFKNGSFIGILSTEEAGIVFQKYSYTCMNEASYRLKLQLYSHNCQIVIYLQFCIFEII